jgi:hypothetical protein
MGLRQLRIPGMLTHLTTDLTSSARRAAPEGTCDSNANSTFRLPAVARGEQVVTVSHSPVGPFGDLRECLV